MHDSRPIGREKNTGEVKAKMVVEPKKEEVPGASSAGDPMPTPSKDHTEEARREDALIAALPMPDLTVPLAERKRTKTCPRQRTPYYYVRIQPSARPKPPPPVLAPVAVRAGRAQDPAPPGYRRVRCPERCAYVRGHQGAPNHCLCLRQGALGPDAIPMWHFVNQTGHRMVQPHGPLFPPEMGSECWPRWRTGP